MDVSHIVTVGCSFTYCQGLENITRDGWPALIAKHFNTKLVNLAVPGVGNDTIHRITYEYICENLKFTNSKPLVILGFSQIDRREEWYKMCMGENYDDYRILSKPKNSYFYRYESYQQSYLKHYDETNYYRRTLLYKLSLMSLFENLKIPYIMTNLMPLDRNENIKIVDNKFSGMARMVNENIFHIPDVGELTKWKPKLPCGHDTAETMIEVSDHLTTKIKELHPSINFKTNILHLELIDFIKNSKYHQKFPEWCDFVL